MQHVNHICLQLFTHTLYKQYVFEGIFQIILRIGIIHKVTGQLVLRQLYHMENDPLDVSSITIIH